MKKPSIKINLRQWNYAGFISLGNTVIAGLTANVNFAVPAVPVASLQTAVTDVETALGVWAPAGSRGSKADLLDLRQKTTTLSQLLTAEAQYVLTTAQLAAGSDYEAMAAIISTSGYELKSEGSPQGVLEMPVGLHRFVSRRLAPNMVKLKWNRPLNARKGNVKDYHIYRAATPDFSMAVEIGSSTTTSFIDTNTTGTMQTWTYWVVAVNTAGNGAPTDALTVSVLPA